MSFASNYSKITRPVLPEVFQRQRLFRLLDEGRRRPVVWVSAPGGSGKTTLVASYLDARRLPCLWYQVDDRDADIATFFHHMGLAAKKAMFRKKTILPLLTTEYLTDVETFARSYFERLYSMLKPPFTIVFDNYQDVRQDSGFQETISRGMALIPDGINVIVISRFDPPQTFARLRANRTMDMIGGDDIRFTLDETREMLRLGGQGKLSAGALHRIYEKTDGWAAGLVLLLEKARHGDITEDLIAKVTRDSIFDYFASEIFEDSDYETRSFLLKTSFLPSIAPGIAEALTGSLRTREILSRLSSDHFFTTGQKGPNASYQYHPLFREFLLARTAEVFTKEEITETRKLAAGLLEKHGQIEDAVDLFLKAGDWTETTRLICSSGPFLFSQGRSTTVKEWIDRIPAGIVEQTPYLLLWQGNCLMMISPRDSNKSLEKALEGFKASVDRTGIMLSCTSAITLAIHIFEDYVAVDSWIDELEKLLQDDQSFPSQEIESLVTVGLFCAIAVRQPHRPELVVWEKRAFDLLLKDKLDSNSGLMAAVYLAVYNMWMGNFARSTVVLNKLLEISLSPNVPDIVLLAGRTTEVMHNLFVASFEPCIFSVYESLELADKKGMHIWDTHLMDHGAAAALSSGNMQEADRLLRRFEQNIKWARLFDKAYYYYLVAWRALLQGDPEGAFENQKIALQLVTQSGYVFAQPVVELLMAEIQHDRGDEGRAAGHLTKAYEISLGMNSKLLEYMCRMVEARMLFDRGREEEGIGILRRAMKIGRENNFLTFMAWRPEVMTRLCIKALECGIEADYVCDLIRRRNLVPETPPLHLENWPWRLKVRTLGDFLIEKDGVPVAFGAASQRKPLDMLKALIAFGGENVREEDISDILWPDADGDAAHSAFTTTLSRLRKLIGDDAIVVKGRRVGLGPQDCWTDVQAFDFLMGRLKAAKGKDPGEAVSLLEKILGLYRGPLFAGEADCQHYYSLRERLRTRFLGCIIDCGKLLVEKRGYEAAISIYRKGLEVDELSEEFYRGLMSCYVALGRYSEGLAVYRRCRDLLERTFDVRPSRETENLYRELKKK